MNVLPFKEWFLVIEKNFQFFNIFKLPLKMKALMLALVISNCVLSLECFLQIHYMHNHTFLS